MACLAPTRLQSSLIKALVKRRSRSLTIFDGTPCNFQTWSLYNSAPVTAVQVVVVGIIFIHSFITRFPIRRSGALQQTFYGSPPACPVLGFPPPCN